MTGSATDADNDLHWMKVWVARYANEASCSSSKWNEGSPTGNPKKVTLVIDTSVSGGITAVTKVETIYCLRGSYYKVFGYATDDEGSTSDVAASGPGCVYCSSTISFNPGTWHTIITIDPQQTGFNDAIGIDSVLTVVYTVGDWVFASVTTLDETGWLGQDFEVGGVLGAFSISSGLVFDPDVPEFTSWGVDTGVSIAGLRFDVAFDLEDKDATLALGVSGVAGDVVVGVDVTLGGDDNDVCDLNWGGIDISLGFPFCCGDFAATIAFDCDGFDYVEFTTGGIAIPNLPWLAIDAVLTFTMQTKSLVLSPTLDFGDIVCFDLDIDIAYVGGDMEILSIDSFLIEGISLTCDIGAVTFTGASTFGTPLYKDLYWEYYSIGTNDDACCGPFDFDLTFYFLEGGAKLFDVALIDANMSLQVSSQFTFNMGLEINVETGAFTEWTIGFLVEW